MDINEKLEREDARLIYQAYVISKNSSMDIEEPPDGIYYKIHPITNIVYFIGDIVVINTSVIRIRDFIDNDSRSSPSLKNTLIIRDTYYRSYTFSMVEKKIIENSKYRRKFNIDYLLKN